MKREQLLDTERRIAAAADASLFVSEVEAELFRNLAPDSARSIHALNNGVDFDFFNPDRGYADPYTGCGEVLAFTGQMDYWANVDAVTWFANDVLPRIRESVATANFWIVGASPTPAVKKLEELPGVCVTGRVPDIRPYIAHATAIVAPLRVARGVQNKVLEAMAMAKTVVATPQAVDGIDARPGHELCVAGDPNTMATTVVDMLRRGDRGAFGKQARARVLASYGWGAHLACLNTILEGSRV